MASTMIQVTAIMNDNTRHEVTVCNPDFVRFEMTAAKHHWPEDSHFLRMTFCAWHAMHRTGTYEGTFEQFRDTDCMAVELDTDEEVGDLGKATL